MLKEGGKEEVWPAHGGSGEGMKELMKESGGRGRGGDTCARGALVGVFVCWSDQCLCSRAALS